MREGGTGFRPAQTPAFQRLVPQGRHAPRLDLAIECLLTALLAFMPLAMGAVQAWSELVVVIAAGAMGLLLAIARLTDRQRRAAWSWIYLPLLLLVGLCALQLLPLPAAWVAAISPTTAETRRALLADLPGSERVLRFMTLSFYPLETRRMLRIVLAVAVVFVTVVNVYRRPEQIQRLLGAIAIIGAAVAVVALAQDLSGTRSVYWRFPQQNPASGGPFVNRNNFAQFANMSIGAALGLLLVYLVRAETSSSGSPRFAWAHMESMDRAIVKSLVLAILLGAIAIFLSGSRGGMFSMVAAFLVTGVLVALRRRRSGLAWVVTVLCLGIFATLLYVGFERACERVASIRDLQKAAGGRWQVNRDVWQRMVPQFRNVGIGLGAHEVVYPGYSRLPDSPAAGHVENEYLQLIEELGIAGAVIVGLFLLLLVAQFVRVLRRQSRSIHAAVFGVAFAIVAVAVHSTSDFGQRLPAHALLCATLCGVLFCLGRIGREKPAGMKGAVSGRALAGPMLIAGAAIWGWALWDGAWATVAESHWARALYVEQRLSREGWQGSDDDFAELLIAATAAADAQRDNVLYLHWLNVWRWRSISRERDARTGQYLLGDEDMDDVRRIVAEFHAARAICPTYGPNYCMAGQLELLILDDAQAGESHIRRGVELAPTHPVARFVAAQMLSRQERWDQALQQLRRAVDLGHPLEDAIDLCLRDCPELALELAADNSRGLLYIASRLEISGENLAIAHEARTRARDRLAEQARQPDAPACVLASYAQVLAKEQRNTEAAEYYRAALAKEHRNEWWHLARAQALGNCGQFEEAIHEARICLWLRPGWEGAKRLVGELTVKSGLAADE